MMTPAAPRELRFLPVTTVGMCNELAGRAQGPQESEPRRVAMRPEMLAVWACPRLTL